MVLLRWPVQAVIANPVLQCAALFNYLVGTGGKFEKTSFNISR